MAGLALITVLGCSSETVTVQEPADDTNLSQKAVNGQQGESEKEAAAIVSDTSSARAQDTAVSSKTAPPIIGQLRGRNHTIIIHASSDGPRFTVTTPDGRVVAAALTSDEIRATHPEIYDTYKKTLAQYDKYIDASISVEATR
jgi:hypothetical protein